MTKIKVSCSMPHKFKRRETIISHIRRTVRFVMPSGDLIKKTLLPGPLSVRNQGRNIFRGVRPVAMSYELPAERYPRLTGK